MKEDKFKLLNKKLEEHAVASGYNCACKSEEPSRRSESAKITLAGQSAARAISSRSAFNSAHPDRPKGPAAPMAPKPPVQPSKPKPVMPLKPLIPLK